METRKAIRIALMTALCAASAVPCSFDSTPAFSFRVRPDDPIDAYTSGRIGIIGPEYARSYLVVAYRYLSGNPPSAAERDGFTSLIEGRLHPATEALASKAWEAARAEMRGVTPRPWIDVYRSGGNYTSFINCTEDAFAKATEVLRDRAARFGAKSAAVASWLEAQEAVFANCGEGEVMPKPADPTLPALIRADRAYQIAAANFYATKYDAARAQFLQIASDRGSPWHETARLLATRAMLRKATIEANAADYNTYHFLTEPLQQAEKDLRAVLADASMARYHGQAGKLLRFAVFRLRPRERFAETSAALTRGGAGTADEARANLDEYTRLLDREEEQKDFELPADDLKGWITAFKSRQNAIETWRATKKTHWLVAALAAAGPDDAAELLDASKNVGAESAAYPVIACHRARLLAASGKHDAARAEIDRVLALDETKLPPSSRNLLLDQRRSLAASLAGFVRDLQMIPVGNELEQTPETFDHPVIPADAADTINESMPLDMLAEIAEQELPRQLHTPLLIAAWTRAILLEREDVAARLAPAVLALDRTMEPRFARWQKATGDGRRFAAADLIVHYGALQPEVEAYGGRLADETDLESVSHWGGNWWCFGGGDAKPSVPPFLSDPEIAEAAAAERLALSELGAGATFLLRAFLDLAVANPKDPRVPEGLALAVRGTRWACGDGDTDTLAERAFNLLHKRYASTTWAKETPYWYRSGF